MIAMTASGRKQTVKFPQFDVIECPLSGKADITVLIPQCSK
jgi:hypothetical protein